MLAKETEQEKNKTFIPDIKNCLSETILKDKLVEAVSLSVEEKKECEYLKDVTAYKVEVSQNPQYKKYFEISAEEQSLLDQKIAREKNDQLYKQQEKLNQQQDKLDQQQALLLHIASVFKDNPSLLKQVDPALLSSCLDLSTIGYNDGDKNILGKTSDTAEESVLTD